MNDFDEVMPSAGKKDMFVYSVAARKTLCAYESDRNSLLIIPTCSEYNHTVRDTGLVIGPDGMKILMVMLTVHVSLECSS